MISEPVRTDVESVKLGLTCAMLDSNNTQNSLYKLHHYTFHTDLLPTAALHTDMFSTEVLLHD